MIVKSDPETLIASLYINRMTRYFAASELYVPSVQQSMRELVHKVCIAEQLPYLRQLLAPLVMLGPDPPSKASNYSTEHDYSMMDAELRTIASKAGHSKILINTSSLFFHIFRLVRDVRVIQRAVLERSNLAQSASMLICGLDRLYPSPKYENDENVRLSLLYQDIKLNELTTVTLLCDKPDLRSATEKVGHSIFAIAMKTGQWRLQENGRFLHVAIIHALAKGYKLQPVDIQALRQYKRVDVFEGLLKWALYCGRNRELRLLLTEATPEESAMFRAIMEQHRLDTTPPAPAHNSDKEARSPFPDVKTGMRNALRRVPLLLNRSSPG